MAKVIEVIYEKGVFKPLQEINLPEKVKGKVIIEEKVMGDIEEFVEKIDEILKNAKIKEDPLKILLETRNRQWK